MIDTMHQRLETVGLLVVFFGLVVGLDASETALLTPKSRAEATRTLSFPTEPWLGNLYLEPESGPGWDPVGVRLLIHWDYHSAAMGEVRVPKDRNVRLDVMLALSSREAAGLRRQNPRAHQMLIADRVRESPADLSGLSSLDPNGLFWLSVGSAMYGRTGGAPEMLEPLRHLTGLQILTLAGTGVTDTGLAHLRSLRSLKGLELTQFPIGERGLAVLKDLPALEYLSLNTGLTDAGLKQVAQIRSLRWLSIVGGRMWGPGLAELAHLPRLERLCFWGGSTLSDRHIKHLEGLTRIKGLTLHGADALTDASLASIGKLTNLEELYFVMASPRFTPAGIAHLQNVKNLKKVKFAQTWVGRPGAQHGDDIARQLAAIPQLESIEQIGYLSAEGMESLATLRHLKCLDVSLRDRNLDYYGPTGLSHLASLSGLEELAIGSDDLLSDTDLASLQPLSHLRKLCILRPSVTDRGLASIGKLKQLEHLHLGTAPRSGLNHLNGLSNLQHLTVTAWSDAAEPGLADELILDLSGLTKTRELHLSGLPLHDDDLAFLKHLPLLETLMIQPTSSLTGASLRHLRELPKLNLLRVHELSDCTGEDLAHLSTLPELRCLILKGDITDAALASLTGPSSLESLHVTTDHPIQKETLADLTDSHPVIEYIHIQDLTPTQTSPVEMRKRKRVSRPAGNRRAPARRPRGRR